MELLSQSNAEALRISGQSDTFSDSSFESIVQNAASCVLDSSRAREMLAVPDADSSLLKQTYPAVITLFIEAAKTETGSEQLDMILDDCKMPPKRKEIILETYKLNKQKFRSSLARLGNSLPHVVDVDWRLDYNLKNSQLNKVMDLQYTVALKTDQREEQDDVQFSCTREQLQDFVGKLKEAVKAVERASQN